MTDKHTNANDAGRRVGEPRLVAGWRDTDGVTEVLAGEVDKLIVEFSQYKGAEPVGGVGGYQSRCVEPDDEDRGVRSAGVSSSLSTAPMHSPRESMRCSASKYRSTVSYSKKNEACCTHLPDPDHACLHNKLRHWWATLDVVAARAEL